MVEPGLDSELSHPHIPFTAAILCLEASSADTRINPETLSLFSINVVDTDGCGGCRASLPLQTVIPGLTASQNDSFPEAPYLFLVRKHALPEAILITGLFLSPQVPLVYFSFLFFFY